MDTPTDLHRPEGAARAVLDAYPDAVLVVDDAGITTDYNARALQLLDLTARDLVGTCADDHVHIPERTALTIGQLIHANPKRAITCSVVHRPERHFEIQVAPMSEEVRDPRWLVVLRDTTSRLRREQQLRESVKMEAVQALASHVANNFNNALAAISGNIEAAHDHLTTDDASRRELSHARDEVRRAARLVRQLQRVSRANPAQCRTAHPQQLIDEAVTVARNEYPNDVGIETFYTHGDATIHVDGQQITDLLVSFLQNARDAMPTGGTTHVTSSLVSTEGPAAELTDPLGQDFVRIDVQDTGRGIPEEHLPHVFEPFFTTKHHAGAGLGLAGVYEVLKHHNGGIEVESTPGEGTTIKMYLPRSRERVEPQPVRHHSAGNETILVVDDEAPVRRILRRALQSQGYRVLEASDGDEGLAVFDANHQEIRLVILDVLMPRMSGWEVLDVLRTRKQSPPVIVQTGYTASERTDTNTSVDAFLRKPYDLSELLGAVREALDGPRKAD